MIQQSIKIELFIEGPDSSEGYVMLYPEIVQLKLELSRSGKYWGVFISVVESFQAIKEDRDFVKSYFDLLQNTGYNEDYKLKILISTLEGDQYTPIYTGVAIPAFEDDTKYITVKFNQDDILTEFLDGNKQREADIETDGVLIDNLSVQNECGNVIAGYKDNTQIDFNQRVAPFTMASQGSGQNSILFVPVDNTGIQTIASSKSILQHDSVVDTGVLSKDFKTEGYQNEFVDSERIRVPKRSKITFSLESDRLVCYRTVLDFTPREIEGVGEIKLSLSRSSMNTTGSFVLTRNTNNFFIRVEPNQVVTIENDTDFNETVQVNYTRGSVPTTFDSWSLTYKFLDEQNFDVYYTLNSTKTTIKAIPVTTLTDDFENEISDLYDDYYIVPNDGLNANPTGKYNVNISNLIEDIGKSLCIGVNINPLTGNLRLRRIQDMFQDREVLSIDESNIYELKISLNAGLTHSTVKLGTTNRNYDYVDGNYDHTRQVTYKGFNVFSTELNLSPLHFKCQSNDLTDLVKDYFFDLNQEGKDDEKYILLNNTKPFSGTNNILESYNNFFPAFQWTVWSWLLRVISPTGFKLVDNNNLGISLDARANYQDFVGGFEIGEIVDNTNYAFTRVPAKITLRKINATLKLTTEQYNAIVADTEGYIVLFYKGVEYRGYINNLTLEVGKNMLAEVELLEKYEL